MCVRFMQEDYIKSLRRLWWMRAAEPAALLRENRTPTHRPNGFVLEFQELRQPCGTAGGELFYDAKTRISVRCAEAGDSPCPGRDGDRPDAQRRGLRFCAGGKTVQSNLRRMPWSKWSRRRSGSGADQQSRPANQQRDS